MYIYVISKEVPCTTLQVSTYRQLIGTLGFPEICQINSLADYAVNYALNTRMFEYYEVLDFLEPKESSKYRGMALPVEVLGSYLENLYMHQSSPKVRESIRIFEYLIKLVKKEYIVFIH